MGAVEFGRELRARRGSMSQADLAARLSDELGREVKRRSVGGWESGEYLPRERDIVVALEEVLDAGGVFLALAGYGTSLIEERVDRLEGELRELRAVIGGLAAALERLEGRLPPGPTA